MLICYLSHHVRDLLAKFGFAALISPVYVADKAKSDGFELYLDMNYDLLKKFLIYL